MSRNVQWYGWRPDMPDKRDMRYGAALKPKESVPLPSRINLTGTMPEIQSQGEIGSCTAHATVALLEHNQIVQGLPVTLLSRLFAYYNARAFEGSADMDSGAALRDVIFCLAKQGAAAETVWPYDISKFAVRPSAEAYADAIPRKITSYARLNSLDDMLSCLAAGHPFVFGFTVYDGFESEAMATTGILRLPGETERPLGGHAVCAVGYDMPSETFIVRNSWGTDWGQSGYFTMPFAYLENRDLSDDFWTVRV